MISKTLSRNPGDKNPVPGIEESAPSGELVIVVRAEVLDTVGHVLGNLFQRLYFLVDRVAEASPLAAGELQANVGRLEAVLQLFLDYVTPHSPALRVVSLADIVQGAARRFEDVCGEQVRVECVSVPAGEVLVDAGQLTRAFDLMASRCAPRDDEAAQQVISIETTCAGGWAVLHLTVPRACLSGRNSEDELRWAMAEKLIDLHGGTLRQELSNSGGLQWLIQLPLYR